MFVLRRKGLLTTAVLLFTVLLATSVLVAQTAVPATPVPGAANPLAVKLGFPPDAKLLIIHADDLGMNHSLNRATFEALDHGWVSSASILVPCPWFPEVAIWAKSHPKADLGIHLALTSEWLDVRWRPLMGKAIVPTLVDDEGYMPLTETAAAASADPTHANIELHAQIEQAQQAGIRISHFDTHMGTLFQTQPLFNLYRKLGREYGVPILLPKGTPTADQPKTPVEVAPGGIVLDRLLAMEPGVKLENWLNAYEDMLAPLPPGTYQLIVHLGYDDDEMRGTTRDHPDYGSAWRQADFHVVRSEEFRRFLADHHFVVVTWRDLAAAMGPEYQNKNN